MPNPSFLLLYDRMVNKTHQFQHPKRQNKRWKEWDLMHILFAWRLRTEVLACCYSQHMFLTKQNYRDVMMLIIKITMYQIVKREKKKFVSSHNVNNPVYILSRTFRYWQENRWTACRLENRYHWNINVVVVYANHVSGSETVAQTDLALGEGGGRALLVDYS